MSDAAKVQRMLKGVKCPHCGMEAKSQACCYSGANHYIFNWTSGGWNTCHGDSPEEAYQKVMRYSSNLKPVKDSFRKWTAEEDARLCRLFD